MLTKRLIVNYRSRDLISKLSLIKFMLVDVPFFYLHELSHLFIIYLFNRKFTKTSDKIFFIKKDCVGLNLELIVKGKNNYQIALIAIIPNIVYFSLLIWCSFNYIVDVTNTINLITYIYVLMGMGVGTCSDVNIDTFEKYLNRKKEKIVSEV